MTFIASAGARLATAGIVLLGAFQTPLLEHAHAGGDRAHHHEAQAAEYREVAAGGVARRFCPGTSGTQACIRGATRHVHVYWLGYEFTLPADLLGRGPSSSSLVTGGSSVPGIPNEDSSSGAHWLVLNGDARHATPTQELDLLTAPLLALEMPACDLMLFTGLLRPVMDSALPNNLCALARHERSGVQLA